MTILIVIFGLMTLLSLVIVLSAVLMASRSDKEWNEWKDLEEFERSLQEQTPQRAKPPPASNDESTRDNINDSDITTSRT